MTILEEQAAHSVTEPVGTISTTIKNIGVNILYYAITIVLVPSLLLRVESSSSPLERLPSGVRLASFLLGFTAAVVQGWSIIVLQLYGKGTPSPAFPTRTLVTQGPYAIVRNPLNIGEVMLILALAGWFGSWTLVIYAALAWIAFHFFIIVYEEPRHRMRFGTGYEEYMASVHRWLPRFRGPHRLFKKEEAGV